MSNWYEELPYGPLTEQDYNRLVSILRLSDPFDPLAKKAIEVATQRLTLPAGSLRRAIHEVFAEFQVETSATGVGNE